MKALTSFLISCSSLLTGTLSTVSSFAASTRPKLVVGGDDVGTGENWIILLNWDSQHLQNLPSCKVLVRKG